MKHGSDMAVVLSFVLLVLFWGVCQPTPITQSSTTSVTTTTAVTTAPGITIGTTTTRPVTTVTTARPVTTASPATTAPPTTAIETTTTAVVVDAISGQFVSLINQERSVAGVQTLGVDDDLTEYAVDWSMEMASRNELSHSDISQLLGPWGAVGENVGRGGTVEAIWQAFLNSGAHHANIVDARFEVLGVGSVVRDGVIWTTHVFAG